MTLRAAEQQDRTDAIFGQVHDLPQTNTRVDVERAERHERIAQRQHVGTVGPILLQDQVQRVALEDRLFESKLPVRVFAPPLRTARAAGHGNWGPASPQAQWTTTRPR
jgi:hypothetical protein